MWTRIRPFLVLAASLAAGVPAAAVAQAAPAPLEDAVAPVVPVRATEDIRRDLEQAAVAEQIARDSADLIRVDLSRAKARIDIHKSELATLKRRLDLAKKEKNESERLDLETTRKTMEADLRLLERARAVQEVRVQLASARGDAARAWKRAVEAEQALDARRAEAASRAVPGLGATLPPDADARRAERRVLELRRDAAAERRDVAERERDLAQRQVDFLDAQSASFAPRR